MISAPSRPAQRLNVRRQLRYQFVAVPRSTQHSDSLFHVVGDLTWPSNLLTLRPRPRLPQFHVFGSFFVLHLPVPTLDGPKQPAIDSAIRSQWSCSSLLGHRSVRV